MRFRQEIPQTDEPALAGTFTKMIHHDIRHIPFLIHSLQISAMKNRVHRFWMLTFWMFHSILMNVSGQTLDERIATFRADNSKSAATIFDEILPLYRTQWTTARNDDINLWKLQLTWAAVTQPDATPEDLKKWLLSQWPDQVPVEHPLIASYEGHFLYNKGLFPQAIKSYESAENLSTDSTDKAHHLENIAVCYVQLDEPERAIEYFENSLEISDSPPNPLTINNLAGIHNSVFHPEAALNALDLLNWEHIEGDVRRFALINRLDAHRILDSDADEFRIQFQQLIETFPMPNSIQEFSSVATACLILDDTIHWGKIRDVGQALVADQPEFANRWMGELNAIVDLGDDHSHVLINNIPFSKRWGIAKARIQSELDLIEKFNAARKNQVTRLNIQMAEALTRLNYTTKILTVISILGLLLLAFATITIWQRQQVRKLRAAVFHKNIQSNHKQKQAIASIRDAITKGNNINTALVHLSNINDILHGDEQPVDISSISDERIALLSESEFALLDHLARGYTAKESSILLHVSSGHIYNMRSSIREKLQLPKNEEITDWLQAQAQKKK